MRPIDKGAAPRSYTDYEDAKQDLTNRLGCYCSYCERRILTNLAVEHILPKDTNLGFAHLRNEWNNFLLSCVNCNSSKRTTIIEFDKYLLPDRDNTFDVFTYNEISGEVDVRQGLSPLVTQMAQKTLDLVALNRPDPQTWTPTNLFAALGRINQRIAMWLVAKDARADYEKGEVTIKRLCAEARANGYFSIWMAAFEGIKEVRIELIKAFSNTAPDCFDIEGKSISPRPANGLEHAGKS